MARPVTLSQQIRAASLPNAENASSTITFMEMMRLKIQKKGFAGFLATPEADLSKRRRKRRSKPGAQPGSRHLYR